MNTIEKYLEVAGFLVLSQVDLLDSARTCQIIPANHPPLISDGRLLTRMEGSWSEDIMVGAGEAFTHAGRNVLAGGSAFRSRRLQPPLSEKNQI